MTKGAPGVVKKELRARRTIIVRPDPGLPTPQRGVEPGRDRFVDRASEISRPHGRYLGIDRIADRWVPRAQ
jgi:hypothetical protein